MKGMKIPRKTTGVSTIACGRRRRVVDRQSDDGR
jgi:hypothetical protein